VDPLAEIAGLCRDEAIWLHVDGAYGGFVDALPEIVARSGRAVYAELRGSR
jgi:hypothetical protein